MKYLFSLLFLFTIITGKAQLGMIMDYTKQNCPQIGLLLANTVNTPSVKSDLLYNTLHTSYIRFAIQAQVWDGHAEAVDAYEAAGLGAHWNFGVDNGTNWMDPTVCANTLNAALTEHPLLRKSGAFVLDNEELNSEYRNVDMAKYVAIANACKPIANKFKMKMASGGVGNFFAINAYTFRYLKAKYGQVTADLFGDEVFLTNGQYNAANQPNLNPTLETFISELDTVVQCDAFDILNFHMYGPLRTEPNPATSVNLPEIVFRYMKECFTNANPRVRRLVMINEFGNQACNYEPEILNKLLSYFWKYGYYWQDDWSGSSCEDDKGLGATSVTDNDGTVRPLGDAWIAWQTHTYRF